MKRLKRVWRNAKLIGELVVFLLGGCAGGQEQCERVRSTVNDRFVACSIPGFIKLDCDSAQYHSGDVEGCIEALKAASCETVEQTYFDRCDGLFGKWGL